MANKKTTNWLFLITWFITFLMEVYVIIILATHGRDYAAPIFICLLPFMFFGVFATMFFGMLKAKGLSRPSTTVHKENKIIPKNEPVKQSCSPNMSEVVKLTKQVESIKDGFKVINYEVDDSIFVKFEFLKDTVYARINKIDWQNNKNPELVKKYQAVVDSYVEKLNDEYLNIKKQFDNIVDNDVKHEIDNVSLID